MYFLQSVLAKGEIQPMQGDFTTFCEVMSHQCDYSLIDTISKRAQFFHGIVWFQLNTYSDIEKSFFYTKVLKTGSILLFVGLKKFPQNDVLCFSGCTSLRTSKK